MVTVIRPTSASRGYMRPAREPTGHLLGMAQFPNTGLMWSLRDQSSWKSLQTRRGFPSAQQTADATSTRCLKAVHAPERQDESETISHRKRNYAQELPSLH